MDSVSLSECLAFVEEKILSGEFLQIITVNSLMLLETEKDPELSKIFQAAKLVVADSVGILFAARLRSFKIKQRIPGIDLLFALCGLAEKKSWKVFLVGSLPGVAEEAGRMLKNQFPDLAICGCAAGYFSAAEEEIILKEIQEKKAELVFVGLGSPQQEKWIYRRLSNFIPPPDFAPQSDAVLLGKTLKSGGGMCAVGIGGSLDVISGRLYRAPLWMRRLGLEWLFRFLQEPWRWRRILKLFLFFYKVLRYNRGHC